MKNIVVVFILSMLTVSCNPATKLARQQKQYKAVVDEYIKNHPERIDTTTIFIKGADSTSFYKKIADSLAAKKDSVQIKIKLQYKDTCTSVQDKFNEGYALGYTIGLTDFKINQRPTDTVITKLYPTDKINKLKDDVIDLTLKNKDAQITIVKRTSWLWAFIISTIINILLAALLIKKFKK